MPFIPPPHPLLVSPEEREAWWRNHHRCENVCMTVGIASIAATTFFIGSMLWQHAFAHVETDIATHDRCDIIEINHVFSEDGQHVFDQYLFRDGHENRIIAWRMRKQETLIHQHAGKYRLRWYDGGVLRQVEADEVRHTFSQYDPEVTEREAWPAEMRRELSKPEKSN